MRGQPMLTVDQASLHGWMGLAVECIGCDARRNVTWDRIKRKTTKRRLVDIAIHLVCEICDHGPRKVALYRIVQPTPGSDPETLELVMLRIPDVSATLMSAQLVERRMAMMLGQEEGNEDVCNLYSMTSNSKAILDLARAMNRAGNLPAQPGIFPEYSAPIVRDGAEGRELVMARWGMPTPPQHMGLRKADTGITNVRNASSPYWRGWLGIEHRCVVPFTSFSEFNREAGGDIWFALNESRPLAFFAGIWTTWKGVRKVKEGEVTVEIFAFLTTNPNAEVAAIHPKAMPVILTAPEEVDAWLSAPTKEALSLQRPLPDGALRVVARGTKKDGEAA